jgi:nanoRNase/pAp phosphatase (c-di-AMP/oligoRNAs hydrolase)
MGHAPSPRALSDVRPHPATVIPVATRLRRLLAVAREHKRALILTHDNPDPDAVASACALAFLLHECAGVKAQAAYGGTVGRAENKAMIKVLRLPILPVSRVEDQARRSLVGLVDTQPAVGNHSAPLSAQIVIDHHPARPASFKCAFHDVGGPAGATSSLVTAYLRAANLTPGAALATALFYGIKSDTRDLGREVRGLDVDSYNWLFPLVDKSALSHIEHPKVPARYFAAYHRAYEVARLHGEASAVVIDLGEVYVPEIVPEVAEKLVSLEGLRWSLAAGVYAGEVYLSLRLNDKRVNAGQLVRAVCAPMGGSAGGHGAMAGARIPLAGREPKALVQQIFDAFLRKFKLEPGPGEPLVPA